MSFHLNINVTDSVSIIIIIIVILQEVLEGQENRQNHPFLFLPETHTQHSQTAGVIEEFSNEI